MSAADLWERIRSSHYHPWLRAWPRRYAFAVLAVAVVTALQLGLRQLGLLHLTFTLFYPTVVLVAMQAGFGPGILATALAATSGGYFFLEPQNSFVVRTPEDLVAPTLFAFIGVSLTLLTYSRNRAKEALRVTESDLNRAQAVAHVGSWHYDIPGNALALSEETYRIMGLPPGSLVTPEQTIEIFHPDDKERIRRACNVALESGTYEGEGRVLVGGRTRRVRIQANIERDVEGRPLAAVGTVQDITEHKLAQERLREFERVVEGLDDMILVVDRDYRYVLANRAFLGARGVEPKQLVGRRLAEIMGDEVFETTIKPKLEECFQGKVVNYEKRYNYPSLGERDFCVSYFPLTGPTGVERVAVLMQDVTEKKRAAEALRESEDRCRDLIENSEDLVCTHDLEGRLLSMNPAPARFLGYEVGELLKIPMRELIAPEFREQFDAYLERIRTTGADKGLLCVLTRTGERRIWEYNNTLRTEGVPSPLVRGMARDITERKQVETELRRREHDYRQFVAQSSEGILREDLATAVSVDLPEDELISRIRRDSYVAECNDALAKMYGFQSAQDLIGKRLAEMLIPGDPGNLELMRDYVRGGFRLLERESHEVDIHGNPKIFRNSMFGIVESGRLLRTWGIQRDVTERVRLEEEHARAQALVSLQKEILEMIAKGRPLEESLTTLVRLIESQITGLFASVVLLDEDGVHVRHGAAPSLPEGFAKAIDGAAIGPSAGSCGTAMYRKETVIVTDVVEDPLWKDYRDLALANGLRACWSAPVFSAEGKVLGSFAMYYREPRGPSAAEMRLVEVATHLASIAIERRRGEDSLRKSEERFRVALKDSPITVFNQDRDLHYTWVYNPSFHWQNEIVGKTDDEIVGADQARRLNALKRRVLETGTGARQEVVIPHNGKKYSFEVAIEPLFDSQGHVMGITGAAMDVARLRELADSLEEAKDKLVQEKQYLENEIKADLGFENIIGQSTSLQEVLKQVRVVAPTDSTVLLLGETGTGKELVARAIHSLSGRADKNFIKLNCAAVPTGLLESELFGHEKGAFTSAVSQKIGRLELADKGTLFLDEIGELPLELQPKLLRVLQDREFERLGGVRTLQVDVRIISATNRDLIKDVAEKQFREDLFYRLNVFPISLPALRSRRTDIPVLVQHFVQKHASRMGKRIETIPKETMNTLENWSWPGNIRELENMIERMVILTKGSVLAAPAIELAGPQDLPSDDLTEMEREHIIHVLQETKGVLSGAQGAANRLGIKRTTLQSMLKRFGIEPQEFRRRTGTLGRE